MPITGSRSATGRDGRRRRTLVLPEQGTALRPPVRVALQPSLVSAAGSRLLWRNQRASMVNGARRHGVRACMGAGCARGNRRRYRAAARRDQAAEGELRDARASAGGARQGGRSGGESRGAAARSRAGSRHGRAACVERGGLRTAVTVAAGRFLGRGPRCAWKQRERLQPGDLGGADGRLLEPVAGPEPLRTVGIRTGR